MLVVNNGVEHVNRLEVCQLPCLLVKQFTRPVIIHNPLQSNHFKKEETEKTPCMRMQMPCQAHAMPCEMEQTHLHTTPWTNDNQMDWIINKSNQSFSGRWEGKESIACTILEPKVATRCAGIMSMLCILWINGYTCLHNIPYIIVLANTYVSSSQWCRHVFVSDMLVVNNWVEHVNRLEVCQLPCLLVKQFTRPVIIHNPIVAKHTHTPSSPNPHNIRSVHLYSCLTSSILMSRLFWNPTNKQTHKQSDKCPNKALSIVKPITWTRKIGTPATMGLPTWRHSGMINRTYAYRELQQPYPVEEPMAPTDYDSKHPTDYTTQTQAV